jgi:hypothetical protein
MAIKERDLISEIEGKMERIRTINSAVMMATIVLADKDIGEHAPGIVHAGAIFTLEAAADEIEEILNDIKEVLGDKEDKKAA